MNMIPDFLANLPLPIVSLVVLLAAVQSIFGVGLLVFGTPILLLFGFEFEYVLGCLLPCSIIISFCQVVQGWSHLTTFKRAVPFYVIPFVIVGLVLVIVTGKKVDIKIYIGIVMLVTALIRLWPKAQEKLVAQVRCNTKLYLGMTGLVHGATNMGGGLLTITVNALYSDKQQVRANIAYGYLLMALVQLIVLFSLKGLVVTPEMIVLMPVAGLTYLVMGRHLFGVASARLYYHMMTVLMFVFGMSLMVF